MTQPRTSTTVAGGSLAFPLLLAVLAPLAVVFCLEFLHSLWWAFATYQVGICLLAPAIESRLTGRNWREHAQLLGLMRPSGVDRFPRLPTISIALGLATAVITGGFLLLTRDRFLEGGRLEVVVADWGVTPEQIFLMLVFMVLFNAPAEELFWRGYYPGRVALARPASPPSAALTIVLPAILYASYHLITIKYLVRKTGGIVLMTGGILIGGLIWGWLRQRTDSVWPALLSHSGAVAAYLAVYLWVTQ